MKVLPRPYRLRSRRDRRLSLFYRVNRNFWDCLFGFLFLRIFSCQDLCTWFHRPSRSYFYMASCAGCTSPRQPTPPSDPSQVPCATSRPMAKQRSCIITLNRKLNFSVQGPVHPRKLQEKQTAVCFSRHRPLQLVSSSPLSSSFSSALHRHHTHVILHIGTVSMAIIVLHAS